MYTIWRSLLLLWYFSMLVWFHWSCRQLEWLASCACHFKIPIRARTDIHRLSSSTEEHKFISRMFMIFRLLFITALSLLLVGAGTSLHGDLIGDSLVRAAYIIFTAVILIIIAMIFYLWSEKHKLGPASLIVCSIRNGIMYNCKKLTHCYSTFLELPWPFLFSSCASSMLPSLHSLPQLSGAHSKAQQWPSLLWLYFLNTSQ